MLSVLRTSRSKCRVDCVAMATLLTGMGPVIGEDIAETKAVEVAVGQV
jgi:hypothetical protein